ncbi:MAG: hypothetical protein ABWY07_06715 [Burkholderiales bacterium]
MLALVTALANPQIAAAAKDAAANDKAHQLTLANKSWTGDFDKVLG